jgi:hypothetical protein
VFLTYHPCRFHRPDHAFTDGERSMPPKISQSIFCKVVRPSIEDEIIEANDHRSKHQASPSVIMSSIISNVCY